MDTVNYSGKIIIEPTLATNKHQLQAEWKHVSYVDIGSDISDYYAWFLKKRYNITLVKPLRKAHITFINDRYSDFNTNDPTKTINVLKDKYDGLNIDVELDLNPRTNGKHWWLNVTEESREFLHSIRREIGLERPFSGLHLTIGRVLEKDQEYNDYIRRSILLLGQ